MKVDRTDREIIGMLRDDARKSNASIARLIGVSEATVRRRIRLMTKEGTLSVRAIPNPAKFGLNTSAMIGIDVQPDKLDTVSDFLSQSDEVSFLGVCTGRYDLIAWALVGNLDALREFLENFLAKVPGIRKTETLVLLDIKKHGVSHIAA